jgi:tetratricopeptide (TPR) repeat protein
MIRKNIGKLFTAIFCLRGDASWRNSINRPMKRRSSLVWISILPFLYSCTSDRLAMHTGRQALLVNKPDVALTYFQQVAEMDPNYVMRFSGVFQEGVWTYVGRAQYLAGQLPEARQSLERAVAQHNDDYLARLYLGLTLARSGDGSGGLKDIESGMKGIFDQLEWIVTRTTTPGQFWDVRGEIRSEIQSNLAMIAGKDIDWPKLIASGEWVGKKFEEESDVARQDEIMSNDADPGV